MPSPLDDDHTRSWRQRRVVLQATTGIAGNIFGIGRAFVRCHCVWLAMPAPSLGPDLGRSASDRAPLVSQLLPFLCLQSGYKAQRPPNKSCCVVHLLTVISAAMLVVSCAYQQATAPPQPRQQTTATYKCRPEPAKGCKSIGNKSECDANRRCQWMSESDRARGHCQVIFCRD